MNHSRSALKNVVMLNVHPYTVREIRGSDDNRLPTEVEVAPMNRHYRRAAAAVLRKGGKIRVT